MRGLCPFGEVNEPSSRAFWDDFAEEDEETQPESSLSWDYSSSTEPSPSSIDLLLLVEGFGDKDFVEKILLTDSRILCTLTNGNVSLYKVNGKNIIIGYGHGDLSKGEVTSLLLPYADLAKKVVTITILQKCEYLCEDLSSVKDEILFLRAINSGIQSIPELESPNFITGIAAGVSSYREVKGLPVNSYIAYTDNAFLDTLSAVPLIKLLQQIGVNCPNKYVPKSRQLSFMYM